MDYLKELLDFFILMFIRNMKEEGGRQEGGEEKGRRRGRGKRKKERGRDAVQRVGMNLGIKRKKPFG